MRRLQHLFALLLLASPVAAEEYSLFNPVPDSALRPMNTDRPDITESPYTVDAGHVQAELSFVEYTFDRENGTRFDGWSVLPTNVRVGITPSIDLQVVLQPYEIARSRDGATRTRNQGFGDTDIRLKLNLWGDDGGESAGGLMGYLSIPTGYRGVSSNQVEGGGMFMYAQELPADFDLGGMVEFDLVGDDPGYDVDCLHSITVGHPIVGDIGSYVEYAGVSPFERGSSYLSYFDAGLTYGYSENIQFDAGVSIGLTPQTDDLTVFSGVSIRR